MKQDAQGHAGKSADTAPSYVTISIRITRDTFELLQDAALAHVITGVADGARGVAGGALKQPTISDLIESLIDRHRQILENDAELVRGKKRT